MQNTSSVPPAYHFVLSDGIARRPSTATRSHAAAVASQLRKSAGSRKNRPIASAARRIAAEGWTHMRDKGLEDENSSQYEVVSSQKQLILDRRTSSGLASTGLPAKAGDPFDAFPIKVDGHTQDTLLFALDIIVPANFRGQLLATGQSPRKHRTFASTQDRIRSCIFNSGTDVYGLLAAASSLRAALSTDGDPFDQKASFYVHKAISRLRTQMLTATLDTGPPASAILAVWNLAYVAMCRGDTEAALAHRRALIFLWEACDQGDPYIIRLRSRQQFLDIDVAAKTDSPPILEGTPWQPLPLSRDRLEQIRRQAFRSSSLHEGDTMGYKSNSDLRQLSLLSSRSLGRRSLQDNLVSTRLSLLRLLRSFFSSHTALARSDFLSTDMRTIVDTEFEPWSCMVIWCFSQKRGTATELDGEWVEGMSVAIAHKLLLLRRPSVSGSDWWIYLEDAFRLSLIALLCHISSTCHWAVMAANLRRVKTALERMATAARCSTDPQTCWTANDLPQQCSSAQARLLSWVLQFCLAFTDNAEDYAWFSARAKTLDEVWDIGSS